MTAIQTLKTKRQRHGKLNKTELTKICLKSEPLKRTKRKPFNYLFITCILKHASVLFYWPSLQMRIKYWSYRMI